MTAASLHTSLRTGLQTGLRTGQLPLVALDRAAPSAPAGSPALIGKIVFWNELALVWAKALGRVGHLQVGSIATLQQAVMDAVRSGQLIALSAGGRTPQAFRETGLFEGPFVGPQDCFFHADQLLVLIRRSKSTPVAGCAIAAALEQAILIAADYQSALANGKLTAFNEP